MVGRQICYTNKIKSGLEEFPHVLWHYTTESGLNGIVAKNNLNFWFTKFDCLSDSTEGIEIIKRYKKVCKLLYDKNRINTPFYELVIDLKVPEETSFAYPVFNSINNTFETKMWFDSFDAYICSFAETPNNALMWQSYSKNECGYCVGVRSDLFNSYKTYAFNEIDLQREYLKIEQCKVIYSEEEKDRIIEKMILLAYEDYCDCRSDTAIHNALVEINDSLSKFQFAFKNSCFAYENEYRFICYLPKNKLPDLQNRIPDIRVRQNKGFPIPYIDVSADGKSSLMELGVSQLSNNGLDVEVFLRERNYFNCDVVEIDIPLRY